MPRIKSKQIIGETPIEQDDLTTKGYVDELVGSLGKGITIIDEGEEILTDVTAINFIGGGVYAYVDDSISKKVNIYIAPVDYASHFNTSDGLTNSLVVNPTLADRYISLPTSEGVPFKIGNWGASTVAKTVKGTNSLSYTTVDPISIISIDTTIKTIVYDADGTSILTSHEIILNSNNTITDNNITYTISNFVMDKNKYKANLIVSLKMYNILPNGGRFSISIIHNDGVDGSYTFSQNDLFIDSDTASITVSNNLSLSVSTPYVLKTLSGVNFLTENSLLGVNISGINDLNNLTYPLTKQLEVVGTNTFTENLLVNGEGGAFDTFYDSTWNTKYNSNNVSYLKNDWTINKVNNTSWNHTTNSINDIKITANLYDWGLVMSKDSPTYPYIIDTLVDDSNRSNEKFISETKRLDSTLSAWDSTQSLITYDGGTGLQVLANRLVYPKNNFTLYNNFISEPDYSLCVGVRYYYRLFSTDGRSISNGIIEFSDYNITESDITNNRVGVDISIDKGATWFSLNKLYDGSVITNGKGCRIDNNDYAFGTGLINNNALRFTLGYGGSSNYCYLRIKYTFASVNKYIGGIGIIDSYWV